MNIYFNWLLILVILAFTCKCIITSKQIIDKRLLIVAYNEQLRSSFEECENIVKSQQQLFPKRDFNQEVSKQYIKKPNKKLLMHTLIPEVEDCINYINDAQKFAVNIYSPSFCFVSSNAKSLMKDINGTVHFGVFEYPMLRLPKYEIFLNDQLVEHGKDHTYQVKCKDDLDIRINKISWDERYNLDTLRLTRHICLP